MKKVIIFIFTAVAFSAYANETSRSQIWFRTPFQSSSPERIAGFRFPTLLEFMPSCHGAYFQVVPFGGQSTNRKSLARYFLPFDKSCLSVVEGTEFNATTQQATFIARDLDPAEFNVVTANNAFKSNLTFRPQQTFVGAGFDYLQILSWDCNDVARWWAELSFAVERVENKFAFCEAITDASCGSIGTGYYSSMTAAFDQPDWNYGKIVNCKLKKTGVADIELKVGYNLIDCESISMQAYFGGIFPGGNKPNARYLFGPVVGNNQHFGILFGSDNFLTICADACWDLNYAINMTGRYLFRNNQLRMFDLKDKSWSRYMKIYASSADAVQAASGTGDLQKAGINYFTLPSRVNPGFEGTMTNALVGNYCSFSAEVGYNIYSHQSESVKPCGTVNGIALADITGDGTTNPARTINHQNILFGNAVTAANYIGLTNDDLNLDSASSPATLSHTIYANIGYQADWCCFPLSFDVGGSYEFSHENSILNKYMVWGKIVTSF